MADRKATPAAAPSEDMVTDPVRRSGRHPASSGKAVTDDRKDPAPLNAGRAALPLPPAPSSALMVPASASLATAARSAKHPRHGAPMV